MKSSKTVYLEIDKKETRVSTGTSQGELYYFFLIYNSFLFQKLFHFNICSNNFIVVSCVVVSCVLYNIAYCPLALKPRYCPNINIIY